MVLDEAAKDLESAGLGTRGTDIFEAYLPERPDACLVVFDGSAAPNILGLGSSDVVVERPRVSVWAREATAALAHAKMRPVYERWRARTESTMVKGAGGSTRWISTTAVGAPFVLRRDELGPTPRVIVTCSFDVQKETSTS